MFKLNEVIQTRNGEYVKPFAVQGNIVLCADNNGNTVKRALTDFSFERPREKEVVSVSKSGTRHVEPEAEQTEQTEKTDNTTEEVIEPVETPTEPVVDVVEEPESNTGNVWDTVDDGYI